MDDFLDVVIPGRPVSLNVTGSLFNGEAINLNDFTDIEVVFGSETYTLLSNPENITVQSNNQLDIYISETTETRSNHFSIRLFNDSHPRPIGYPLTNKCLGNLSMPKLCV